MDLLRLLEWADARDDARYECEAPNSYLIRSDCSAWGVHSGDTVGDSADSSRPVIAICAVVFVGFLVYAVRELRRRRDQRMRLVVAVALAKARRDRRAKVADSGRSCDD